MADACLPPVEDMLGLYMATSSSGWAHLLSSPQWRKWHLCEMASREETLLLKLLTYTGLLRPVANIIGSRNLHPPLVESL